MRRSRINTEQRSNGARTELQVFSVSSPLLRASVLFCGIRILCELAAPALVSAQPGGVVPPTRLAILQAEERRAATAGDLLTLRSGIRSRDPQTAILAIRDVGQLARPA